MKCAVAVLAVLSAAGAAPAQESETARLHAEIAKLRAENARLTAEVAALRHATPPAAPPEKNAPAEPAPQVEVTARRLQLAVQPARPVAAVQVEVAPRVQFQRLRGAFVVRNGQVLLSTQEKEAPSPLWKGEFREAVEQLEAGCESLRKAPEPEAALRALDQASKTVMKARAALWRQKDADDDEPSAGERKEKSPERER